MSVRAREAQMRELVSLLRVEVGPGPAAFVPCVICGASLPVEHPGGPTVADAVMMPRFVDRHHQWHERHATDRMPDEEHPLARAFPKLLGEA